mgnify:CR=1 FL=1
MEQAFAELPWLLPLCLIAVGLCMGSFLNVVIYRLPLMLESRWRRDCCELLEIEGEPREAPLTLATPNSHCPHCGAPIRPWQNVPVLSYVLLRGRCGNCAGSISPRYPLVEIATGLATLVLAWHFPLSWALLGAMLFTWALIALTGIDMDHQLLPDDITLPLLWLGLAFNAAGTYTPLADAVIGAMAGYLLLWSIYWLFKLITGKEGMGYGDFKLLAALGAWLGWQDLHLIILMSSVVGALLGGALMVVGGRGRNVPMPFGPYLALAGWITFLWGDALTARFAFLDIW